MNYYLFKKIVEKQFVKEVCITCMNSNCADDTNVFPDRTSTPMSQLRSRLLSWVLRYALSWVQQPKIMILCVN